MRYNIIILMLAALILVSSASANILYFQDYRTATKFDGNVTNTSLRTVFNGLGLNLSITTDAEYIKINPATIAQSGVTSNCTGMIINFSSGTQQLLHFPGYSTVIKATVQTGTSGIQIDGGGPPDWYPALFGAGSGSFAMPKANNYSLFYSACYNSTNTMNFTIFNSTQSGGVYGNYTQLKSSINSIPGDLLAFITANANSGSQFLQIYNWVAWNETFLPQASIPPPPAPSAGSIVAADRYDSVNISHFNVTLTNTTGTFNFTTLNGSISPGIAGNFTINFTRGDYFLFSNYSEINGTSVTNLTPWQAVVNINLSQIITGLELSVNGNNVTTFNGQSSNRTLLVRAAKYNITARRAGYFTITREFSAPTAVTNTTINFINMFTTLINITANERFDSSILTDYNITLSNGTVSQNFTTNNGFVQAQTLNATWSVTLSSGLTNNANTTVVALNTTHTINFTVITAWIDAFLFEKISGASIANFTLLVQNYSGTNSSNGTVFLKLGSFNITAIKNPYFNITRAFNITTKGNLSARFENFTYSILNFSGRGSFGNQVILNFTVNISNSTFSEIVNTTNGSLQLNMINGTFSIFITNFQNASVVFGNINFTFKVNQTFHNINFTLREVGVLGLEFVDERNNRVVNFENISIEMFSDLMSTNFSTNNGSASTPILLPTEYRIRYFSPSYTERVTFVRVTDQGTTDVTFYMINASIETDVQITVSDTAARPIPNARVHVQRYDLQSNTYRVVEILQTNTLGQTTAHLQVNANGIPGEFYKFLVLIDNELKLETIPQYVTSTAISLTVPTNAGIAATFYKTQNITVSLSFNNDTNNFRYAYVDSNNVLTQSCLKVYKITGSTETLYNSTCANTTSASMLISVSNQSNAIWKGVATAQYGNNGEVIPISQIIQQMSQVEVIGRYGAFLMLILILVMFFIGIWNPIVALVLGPLALVFASYAGLTAIPIWVGMGLEAVFLVIGWMLGDRA